MLLGASCQSRVVMFSHNRKALLELGLIAFFPCLCSVVISSYQDYPVFFFSMRRGFQT